MIKQKKDFDIMDYIDKDIESNLKKDVKSMIKKQTSTNKFDSKKIKNIDNDVKSAKSNYYFNKEKPKVKRELNLYKNKELEPIKNKDWSSELDDI